MSSGVAMATIPTMSGMVITLFGLYFYQDITGRIDNLSKNFKIDLQSEGYKL
jgi:biopolymer transport protein ExbB